MSLTKRGKKCEILESCNGQCHPSAMYGVVCIYNTELSSVLGAASCSMCGITAEGARVGTMGWG